MHLLLYDDTVSVFGSTLGLILPPCSNSPCARDMFFLVLHRTRILSNSLCLEDDHALGKVPVGKLDTSGYRRCGTKIDMYQR
jgi:hypothetical protein